MITTIIFDLSEVQLKGFYGVEKIIAKKLGLGEEETKQLLYIPELEQLFLGKISEDDYWGHVLEKNNWNISISELKRTIRNNIEAIDGTKEIIEQLHKKGFKLGLLSDHAREWIEYCEKKFKYHKLFHSKVYSFEIEARKPDEKTFFEILKRLNEKPETCLFVDDLQKNIDGAKKLGMDTILFKNPKQLKRDLKKFSIFLD